MTHKLPELPYEYSALEPHIDTRTMAIHHDKHHQAYVDNLNQALEGYPDLQDTSTVQLLSDLDLCPRRSVPRCATTGAVTLPQHVLAVHEPQGRRHAQRGTGRGHRGQLWLLCRVPNAVHQGGRQPLWQRLDLAVRGWRRGAGRSRPRQATTSRSTKTWCPSWFWTSGSTPTISSSRTAGRIISPPGGTSSTGTMSRRAWPQPRWGMGWPKPSAGPQVPGPPWKMDGTSWSVPKE